MAGAFALSGRVVADDWRFRHVNPRQAGQRWARRDGQGREGQWERRLGDCLVHVDGRPSEGTRRGGAEFAQHLGGTTREGPSRRDAARGGGDDPADCVSRGAHQRFDRPGHGFACPPQRTVERARYATDHRCCSRDRLTHHAWYSLTYHRHSLTYHRHSLTHHAWYSLTYHRHSLTHHARHSLTHHRHGLTHHVRQGGRGATGRVRDRANGIAEPVEATELGAAFTVLRAVASGEPGVWEGVVAEGLVEVGLAGDAADGTETAGEELEGVTGGAGSRARSGRRERQTTRVS